MAILHGFGQPSGRARRTRAGDGLRRDDRAGAADEELGRRAHEVAVDVDETGGLLGVEVFDYPVAVERRVGVDVDLTGQHQLLDRARRDRIEDAVNGTAPLVAVAA